MDFLLGTMALLLETMDFIIWFILVGLIPAVIARNKGRSFVLWWFYGAVLFIVALPHALLMKKDNATLERRQLSQGMQKCQFCAELIKADALVCRYCGKDVMPKPKNKNSGPSPQRGPDPKVSIHEEDKEYVRRGPKPY